MSQPLPLNAAPTEYLLQRLFAVGAIIEMGVGLGAAAFPEQLVELLLNAPLADTGVFVTRLFGTALLVLGLAWWFARHKPREPWVKGCCLGFLVYNLGAGLWILLQALTASERVPLLWTLALFHEGLGLVFAALLLRANSIIRKAGQLRGS
jgi:hypothetical protein